MNQRAHHTKPVLFLDFDRTLFDVDQFYGWLGAYRFPRILALLAGAIPEPDFANMLYRDTKPFLEKVRGTHRLVLLTYSLNTMLQRKKLRGSGILPYFDDVIVTGGSKGKEAKKYLARIGDPGWEHVFVDDSPEQISDMKKVNPDIRAIRISRRPWEEAAIAESGMLAPDLVIRNLDELSATL